MPDTAKPSDKILAHRILRAAGVDQEKLSDSARESFDLLRRRQREDAEDKDAPLPDARETWMFHSGKQLHRFFGGRCVSCAWWRPDDKTEIDNYGKCAHITDQATDASIRVGNRTEALTAPVFGCILWAEIPVADAETIRARTELAISFELLQPFPGPDPVNEFSGQTVAIEAGASAGVIAKTQSGPNG